VEACSGSASWQLGVVAPGVAVMQTSDQSWELNPSYYQYRKCTCLKVCFGWSWAWHWLLALVLCA
jgi:hypothetical protein